MKYKRIPYVNWNILVDAKLADQLKQEAIGTITMAKLLGYSILTHETDEGNKKKLEMILRRKDKQFIIDIHTNESGKIEHCISYPIDEEMNVTPSEKMYKRLKLIQKLM